MRRWLIAAAAVLVVALCARPAAAWWYLDIGNTAYVRGDLPTAAADFEAGLALEPGWHVLHEDRGRAILQTNPVGALVEFVTADCGQPCSAEKGDAEARLGREHDAVSDYLESHAVGRVGAAAQQLESENRLDDAIALERALIAQLGTGMLAEADVASAYDTVGALDQRAAGASPLRARAYRQDAIACFRRASQLAPFNEGYLLQLGFAESAWGSRAAARSAFERVLDLHPHEADAERGLAQLGFPPPDER